MHDHQYFSSVNYSNNNLLYSAKRIIMTIKQQIQIKFLDSFFDPINFHGQNIDIVLFFFNAYSLETIEKKINQGIVHQMLREEEEDRKLQEMQNNN